MTNAAHPDDVLVLSNLSERSYHRQFADRQVLTTTLPARARQRLQGTNRPIRTVYVTELAGRQPGAPAVLDMLKLHAEKHGQVLVIRSVEDWQPQAPSVVAMIRALQPPSKNQQIVTGYRRAIDDVLGLLAEHFEEQE